ncbi:replication initiation protein RepC (plasmid) [Peteryoungia desertarenae]|uniref:Replication initiation protein RepC n=1 Tax=Peteryoungia desertarenae TaxID=1813451 RepID=A0ABX6QSN5_9HYPH|nr:plasmid replication protein RepC [Peteryoungia desertarenae]QLF71529.1 replication initiation protein RepC [Peteryoungia desertarenae]
MPTGNVTTPFGRRTMTLALVKGQLKAAALPEGKTIGKWKVFRDVSEARNKLGLQDRALAVLDALLTFYPHNELAVEHGLVVFPSNAQLSLRAHGIAGTTLRRHLGSLVEAGLILRKDSPNGKRYAHKNKWGEIEDAYGFSLAPLLARSDELAHLAQQVVEERRHFLKTKERLSICRRDLRKLLSAVRLEGVKGEWHLVEDHLQAVLDQLPRSPSLEELAKALTELECLRDGVVKVLTETHFSSEPVANHVQNERHIQNSKTESITELEEHLPSNPNPNAENKRSKQQQTIRNYPLSLVLRACPEIADYGPMGAIKSWEDLTRAAIVVRSMMGIAPATFQRACEVMGRENASITMAAILARAAVIASPGAYLQDLSRRAEIDEFSVGPMLMALLKGHNREGLMSAS